MPVTYDVAVIGGGITGVSAALAAHQRGASVCVLRATPGITALISGAWTGPLRPEMREALLDAGYATGPAPFPLAHERGDLISCDFAATTHIPAAVNEPALICGIAGLPNFNAQALARAWQQEQPLAAQTIELPGTPAAGWTAASVAALIERSPEILLRALPANITVRIIVPAVLGLQRPDAVVERLASEGMLVGEALATQPSIPGWRLMHALERVLGARGIKSFTGPARLDAATGDRVDAVRIGDDTVSARSFVLATGKYAAGGIATGATFTESVFDLPIWLEQLGDVFTSPDPLPLTDPIRSEQQPLMHAGVHTDDMLRPVDRAQRIVYQNVFAAGTIRAGWDVAGSGLGHCSEDGWNAGTNAAA